MKAEKKIIGNTSMDRVIEITEYFSKPENRGNMRLPIPESAYMWQNLGRMYNVTDILRDGPISELPIEENPEIGNISYDHGGEQVTVNEHLDKYPVDAFLVTHKGKIVFERYNTMRPKDKHLWMSAAKVTGSTVMALLEAQGKIDVKKPVPFYIEELKGSDWDNTTVEDALDMANGLDSTEHDEEIQDTRTNPDRGYFKWAVTMGFLVNPNQKETNPIEVLRSMKRKYPGHTAFEYNSINTFIMNRINERVTGKPVNELISDMIWGKIGAEHDMVVAVSPQGYPMTFGWNLSTLRDMARFGMIFTPSWNKVSAERIVPESIVKMIQTTGNPEMYDKGYVGQLMTNLFPGEKGITNRYMWDAILQDGDMLKSGMGSQGLYVSPSRDLVINWFSTGDGTTKEETMARAIAKSFD